MKPTQVHTIRMASVCAYLIELENGLVLVDALWPRCEKLVLHKMRALGRSDLRLIYITHAHLDHYGSAAALRRLTGSTIAVHRSDAEAMARGETPVRSAHGSGRIGVWLLQHGGSRLSAEPTPPDVVLDDGSSLAGYGLDATVVHTPGHTAGSSSLFLEGRSVFVGDLLSSNGKLTLQRLYADDWTQIPRSLERVQALRPEWVYPGHAIHPVRGEALREVNRKGR